MTNATVEEIKEGEDFPGVDNRALNRPPGRRDPRTRTLNNGSEVKWCPECGAWGDHLRADHTSENALVASDVKFAGAIVGASVGAGDGANDDEETGMTATDTNTTQDGTFTRLRLAGLL